MRSVTAHVTGSAGTSYDADFPVVKHGGSWLVCVTRSLGVPTTLPTPSDLPPTPSDTGGTAGTGGTTTLPATASSSTGTAAPALCAFAQLPLQAATTYVSAAEAGSTDLAQSCVYRSSVARTVTARLKGELFAARTTDPSATTVAFVGVDATTKVVVHVTKEPDGKYYVVGVTSG
jgi:hypothetical protein